MNDPNTNTTGGIISNNNFMLQDDLLQITPPAHPGADLQSVLFHGFVSTFTKKQYL